MSGCQTMSSCEINTAMLTAPGPNEYLIIDNVYVLVDGSGSMLPNVKFDVAKKLTQSLAAAMPDGGYHAELLSFGGEWEHEWTHWGPRPFHREQFAAAAAALQWHQGSTPLARALEMIQPGTAHLRGDSAVIIISDGVADCAAACAMLDRIKAAHPGRLCVHTIHIGGSEEGHCVLECLSKHTGCGTLRHENDVASEAGMQQFVREVFFGPERDSDGDGVPDSRDKCPGTPRGARVDELGCWAIGGVYFDTDKATLRPEAAPLLDEAAAVLRNNPDLFVCVGGHTDSRGSEAYNQKLSERRARSVYDALVQRGANPLHLHPTGFGELRPRVPNTTRANLQLNRRVELNVIE
jgi:OOP family OmpA-OmpF porin